MPDKKISVLAALSLLASPIAPSAQESVSHYPQTVSEQSSSSTRASIRRMKHLLAAPPVLQPEKYIQPPLAHHIDAPLPETDGDQIVGIYGNILYPQDKEQMQQKKLLAWFDAYFKDQDAPFPLSPEELNDISLYILNQFPQESIRYFFLEQARKFLISGMSLESALENASQDTLAMAKLYREIAKKVPAWEGRGELLTLKLNECADQIDETIKRDLTRYNKNPDLLLETRSWIEAPFTWDVRKQVFKQMIEKITSVSPNSPYFLALQEVTPQALNDLKAELANRNLQWISFNNISGKETLAPQQEEVLGETTAFTSTLALSADLEVIKVELGDLPTESGSARKILGARVRNIHTNDVFNIFTTHTDHLIRNGIYERTASKIHEFATRFFQDASVSEKRFVLGGDLNAFEDQGGAQYIEKLRDLFVDAQDFRETDFYAPNPIAWSSFIGHSDDTFAARIGEDGILGSNALDHILVGSGIELQAASREAGVYNESGELLDYYKNRDEYMANLQKRITFSDHFFNVVRFK